MNRAIQIPCEVVSTREEAIFSLGNESITPQWTAQAHRHPTEDIGEYRGLNQKYLPQAPLLGTWSTIDGGVWGFCVVLPRDMERSWQMPAFESYPTSCSEVPVSCLLHCEQAAASGSCHYEYSSCSGHVCLPQGNRNRSSEAEPKQASCLLFLLRILSE